MKAEKIYHIYNHGNGEDNLFRSDENYRYFLQKYGEHIAPIADTYAYCLMPNHFHFLLNVKEENSLLTLSGFESLTDVDLETKIIQQFSNFFNAYTKAFNKMYNRKGKLFLAPFQRKPITNSWHFLNTWKYIHYNPVHHGFVESPLDWPHSSVHDYLLRKIDPIILIEAKLKSESSLDFSTTSDFKPNWNDFLELHY
jgi:putative transposase